MNLKVLKSCTLLSFLLLSFCIFTGGEVSAQCEWKVVGVEHQSLDIPSGTTMVRYGMGDRFVEMSVSSGAMCNNVTFGDPAPGVHKICWACVEPSPGSCWTILTSEHRTLNLSGPQTVRFGTATKYVEKTVNNGQKCNSATFGEDPVPGKRKQCWTCSGGT